MYLSFQVELTGVLEEEGVRNNSYDSSLTHVLQETVPFTMARKKQVLGSMQNKDIKISIFG